MKRFFFDLEGESNVSDPGGLLFYSELDAFRAAKGSLRSWPTPART
jgi:hypothetical protein